MLSLTNFLFYFCPETEVKPIRGSRKMHQIIKVGRNVVKCRNFACFCESCFNNFNHCYNQQTLDLFKVHNLELQCQGEDDESTIASQPPSPCTSPELPPPLPQLPPMPRSNFFRLLQQDLIQARRNGFGAFTACAQDYICKMIAYPLPFPVLQPEFERSRVCIPPFSFLHIANLYC